MSTSDDPVVAEVRRVRADHAEAFQHDLRRIFEDLRRSQEARHGTVVTREPKRVREAGSDAETAPRSRSH